MSRALFTGITGLRTHQQKLDIVANNLANMNTIGFKSQATNFSDLLYNTVKSGSGSTDTTGGVNPQNIGSGVQMSSITRKFGQGTLQATGESLDFAMSGDGFFTLTDPSGSSVFTRGGSFAIDGDGRLVDPATGYLVQRFGDLGEATADNFGFQVPGDNSIRVPLGAAIPGQATSLVEFAGNLPATALPPATEVLSSLGQFLESGSPATLATALDDLDSNTTNYILGDQLVITGTNPDGTPFSTTLAANGATVGDLINELNTTMTDATASLTAAGVLEITADNVGEAFMGVSITDDLLNTGGSDWASNALIETTEGTAGDVFELTMEVYDSRGDSHRINLQFLKQLTNGWTVTADIDPASGTMIDNTIENVTFNEDGTFAIAGGTGLGDGDIEIDFASLTNPTTINLDFSQLTHFASAFSLTPSQDGFQPGTLVSVSTSSAGELTGIASNGRAVNLGQLAISTFSNTAGLDPIGGNYFRHTLNSGLASIGPGVTSGRGQVLGGQLETSNVDVAQEFTQLIVAQRGFSANARTITVADEMLEELTNIIR